MSVCGSSTVSRGWDGEVGRVRGGCVGKGPCLWPTRFLLRRAHLYGCLCVTRGWRENASQHLPECVSVISLYRSREPDKDTPECEKCPCSTTDSLSESPGSQFPHLTRGIVRCLGFDSNTPAHYNKRYWGYR